MKMKKIMILGFALSLICSCNPGKGKVDKITENGVEVVLNHLAPYVLRDEPATLTLEKIFSIDTETDSIASLGIKDIYVFDVDSEGNLFILSPPTGPGNIIFKFSAKGEFSTSFGRMGQGPNELEYPGQILAVGPDKIWVVESPKKKISVFQSDGTPAGERAIPGFDNLIPLNNGTFLTTRLVAEDMTARFFPIVLNLADSDFQRIAELDRFQSFPNKNLAASLPEKTVCGTDFVLWAAATGDRIYTGNSERGYEILVYDLAGKLIRKIRKDYTPIKVSEEYKKNYLESYEKYMPDYAKKIYFPENWHPFKSFFTDDEGRLFVMTYEPGPSPGVFIFDIFNRDGVFYARQSLNILSTDVIQAKTLGHRLYHVVEKETGFKELIVSRITWR
jgi:hypothetical protein